MSESLKSAVQSAVLRLLRPLIKWLLAAGVGVGDFVALAKVAYVQVAAEQTGDPGRGRPNVSRVAVLTGLTRIEVTRILAGREPAGRSHDVGRRHRAERVLSGWWGDSGYFDPKLQGPAVLPVRGGKRSFAALVERYSGERAAAGAILNELVRVKAVKRLPDGRIKALSRTYATVRWDPEGVLAFGEHLADVAEALLHNLNAPARATFVRRVVNTTLDPRYIPLLHRDLEQQLDLVVNGIDDRWNHHDLQRQGKSSPEDAGRMGVAVYLFEPVAEPNPEKSLASPGGGRSPPERVKKRRPKAS
jgi:hypothetical protein